jgi:glycosyltransferase involved in cell wall biosynthesis
MKQYAQQDPRIRIVDKANGGLSDARNAGMAIARGTYISVRGQR